MASVILNPVFQVHNAGVPVSGGKVYTYECGTQTDKTTYTDYTQGTANANPVILDPNGQADIYCSGCLKVLIKDSADVILDTIDNIQGFDSTVIQDADRDTKIQVEESDDEDIIRFDIAGTQKAYIDSTGWHGVVSFDQGKGDLRRPVFSWTDANTLSIGEGAAYHHTGTADQFVYWTSAITYEVAAASKSNTDSDTLAASTWYYLYLDDSAIVTQGSPLLDADCFLLVDDAPTWTGTKYGWYGDGSGTATTSDRCIFAVYGDGVDSMAEFMHDGDEVIFIPDLQVDSLTDYDTTFTDSTAFTAPSFVRRARTLFWLDSNADTDPAYGYWRTNGSSESTGVRIGFVDADLNYYAFVETVVILDSNLKIEVRYDASDTHRMEIRQKGWFFPNGM